LSFAVSPETRRLWLDRCIGLAIHTKDESLIETVIYTIGDRYLEYPGLVQSIERIKEESRKVRLAMERMQRA
jgi:hypothetical protein